MTDTTLTDADLTELREGYARDETEPFGCPRFKALLLIHAHCRSSRSQAADSPARRHEVPEVPHVERQAPCGAAGDDDPLTLRR